MQGRLFLALAALLPFLLPIAAGRASPPRSLWVWDTRTIREDDAAQKAFFDFLAAPKNEPKNAIGVLYFDGVVPKDLNDPVSSKRIRSFLRAAHARHLRVDYLTGDPHWALPEGIGEALETVNAVIAFNKAGAADERYDGFQYDVEPHSLPGWPSHAILEGMRTLLDRTNAAIKASKRTLILTFAIPRWYNRPEFEHLDQTIIDRTDEVLIMDYVQKADNFVSGAADEMAYASKAGKKVWVGVETGDTKDEPEATFHALGNARMEAMLSEALPGFSKMPCFAGYAIHHWAAYRDLQP